MGVEIVLLLLQVIVLEQDRRGTMWLILIVNDIVKDGSLETPPHRQLRNIRNRRLYLFVPEEEPENETRPSLTRRELEVLGLVAVGMVSREITDRLCISIATVNNHRQHIF